MPVDACNHSSPSIDQSTSNVNGSPSGSAATHSIKVASPTSVAETDSTAGGRGLIAR